MKQTSDVIIIGGGIIGCALAESLAGEGLDVVLLERGILGREASWAAAGMLAPQSEMEEAGPYMDFCLESRRLYAETTSRVFESSAIDPQYRTEGMLYVAFTEDDEQKLRDRAAWQRELGLGVEILEREEALAREPNLTPDFRMAVHFQEDHQLDPRLMTRGFAVAARRLGARLLEYSPVLRLLSENGRIVGVELPRQKLFASTVILAGGCWSGLLAGLDLKVPTYPVKGQVVALQAQAPPFEHILHSSDVYLAPRYDGRVLIGATEEHDAGFDKSVRTEAVQDLLARATALVPKLGDAEFVDAWAGLRPGTPDRRPILGKSGMPGLVFATGHFRNGILLAPLTAKLIAQTVMTEIDSPKLRPFSIDRFDKLSEPAPAKIL